MKRLLEIALLWLAISLGAGLWSGAARAAETPADAGQLLGQRWEEYSKLESIKGRISVSTTEEGQKRVSLDLVFAAAPRQGRFHVWENGVIDGTVIDRHWIYDGEFLWLYPAVRWMAFLLPPAELPELANPALSAFTRLMKGVNARVLSREFGQTVVATELDGGETSLTATLLDDGILPRRIVETGPGGSRTTVVYQEVETNQPLAADEFLCRLLPGAEVYDGRLAGNPPAHQRVLRFPDQKQFQDFLGHISASETAMRQLDWSLAWTQAEQATLLKPDSGIAHLLLGEVHLNRGQLQEAAGEFDRALSIEPNLLPALVDRGIVHFRLGELDKAAEVLERALALDDGTLAGAKARELAEEVRSLSSLDFTGSPGQLWRSVLTDATVKSSRGVATAKGTFAAMLISPEQTLAGLVFSDPSRDLPVAAIRFLFDYQPSQANVGRLEIVLIPREAGAADLPPDYTRGIKIRVDGRPVVVAGTGQMRPPAEQGIFNLASIPFFAPPTGAFVPVEVELPALDDASPVRWTFLYSPVFHPRLTELVARLKDRIADSEDGWEIENTRLVMDGKRPVVEGTLRNPGRATRERAELTAAFTDAKGQLLAQGRLTLKDIPGGAVIPFRIPADQNAPAKLFNVVVDEYFDWPWIIDGQPAF